MTIQNYLIVENDVVTNTVSWDGNTQTWTPPLGSIVLIQAITPTMIWQAVVVDNKVTNYVLVQFIGAGNIGFTWDGTVLTTNEPKPAIPTIPTQPNSTGTQSA